MNAKIILLNEQHAELRSLIVEKLSVSAVQVKYDVRVVSNCRGMAQLPDVSIPFLRACIVLIDSKAFDGGKGAELLKRVTSQGMQGGSMNFTTVVVGCMSSAEYALKLQHKLVLNDNNVSCVLHLTDASQLVDIVAVLLID